METSQGWGRAQLFLEGLKPQRNSLLEAYYMVALQKRSKIQVKKTFALALASAGGSEDLAKALTDYLEEEFPSLKEEREDFIGDAAQILNREAGQVVDISQYIRADSFEE